MLTLPIKRKWFELIRSGEKKEEYRKITDYYGTRFRNVWGYPAYWGEPQKIRFRNGYSKNSPSIIATCTLSKNTGTPEWGAEPGKRYFVLTILYIGEE